MKLNKKAIMKNSILIIILLMIYSCSSSDVDYIFEQSPEQRIEAEKTRYRTILTDAPDGWKVEMSSTNKLGRWMILTKFGIDGSVEIVSEGIDYASNTPVKRDEKITYRVDFIQNSELIFESLSQFSIWNELPYDSKGDGKFDSYAGPETQLIINEYRDGKLYMSSKSDIGKQDVSKFVFEKATKEDWNLESLAITKKLITFDEKKGKYTRFSFEGKLLESVFSIDERYRVVIYYTGTTTGSNITELPFYITAKGFTLVEPLMIDGVGMVQNFNVDKTGAIVNVENPKLTLVYTDKKPGILRVPLSVLDKMYLGLEVYHSAGDPIGLDIKKITESLRPPYSSDEQRLTLIYMARNIHQDMGKIPFIYPEELTLVYADSDPTYSGGSLHGGNATFVHIPVKYFTDESRMFKISLVGKIEDAYIKAYPKNIEYAKAKAKENMPLIGALINKSGWGVYIRDVASANPIFDFVNEDSPKTSFFAMYPYTVKDVK